MLQKILIATSDSPESAEIFKSGLTLAEKYGAQISILHVLNLFQSGFDTVSNPFMGGSYLMMNDFNRSRMRIISVKYYSLIKFY